MKVRYPTNTSPKQHIYSGALYIHKDVETSTKIILNNTVVETCRINVMLQ